MKEYSDTFLAKQRESLNSMSEELREALELETDLFNELMQNLAIKDRPEVGTERIDNRRLGMVEVVDRERMRRIGAALHHLDAGDYGFCQVCGARIGEERLEAKPDALLCVECRERRDEERSEEPPT